LRNRTVTISLAAIIILIYLLYFFIQNIVLPSGEPIKSHLDNIIQLVQQGKWNEAEASSDQLLKLWDRYEHLLAFNYSEADFSFLKIMKPNLVILILSASS